MLIPCSVISYIHFMMQHFNRSVNLVTLGCSKNLVDSEVLLFQLSLKYKKVLHNSENPADIVIVNTCGFILDAKQESIDNILFWADKKNRGKIRELIVFGCLTERYKSEITSEIPEIDAAFGVNQLVQLLQVLKIKPGKTDRKRTITTPKHYSYLKIAEGCNRKCAFCAIPAIRGKFISQPIEKLVSEAGFLAENGVKELMLIAQDISYYGFDLYKQQTLPKLLEKIAKVPGLDWIRLHYAYPSKFPKQVLEIMKQHDNVCNYLDIPVQHCNESMLKNMRRGHDKKKLLELLHFFREKIPGIALRTTLIVGYPGETEKEFNELLDFIKTFRFERLGAFTYSEEEGTWAADNFNDNVPEELKNERLNLLLQVQQEISREINKDKIGKSFKTIIDAKEGDNYIGRTEYDSPEVDNEVLIRSEKTLKTGQFYDVKIVSATEFDLNARLNHEP